MRYFSNKFAHAAAESPHFVCACRKIQHCISFMSLSITAPVYQNPRWRASATKSEVYPFLTIGPPIPRLRSTSCRRTVISRCACARQGGCLMARDFMGTTPSPPAHSQQAALRENHALPTRRLTGDGSPYQLSFRRKSARCANRMPLSFPCANSSNVTTYLE